MKLSIVIPCYNESKTIAEIVRRLQAADLGIEKEIVAVDDGSKDGTREILQNLPGIRYIFHEKNLGKGGAVKTGFREATGDILAIQDADLEYDPKDLRAIIKPILDGSVEVVLGDRIMPPHDERRKKSNYWLAWFGNHAITWLTNVLYLNHAGEYEACYKAFTSKAARAVEVKTDDFDYDNELVCKLLKRGYKTVDVPIHYYPRGYGEGKKISYHHGFKILWTIFKYRFVD